MLVWLRLSVASGPVLALQVFDALLITACFTTKSCTACPLQASNEGLMSRWLGSQMLSRSHVRMSVWERGAGATLACGTGACATVVAGVLEGRLDRSCRCERIAWHKSCCPEWQTCSPLEIL
jgi:hypothetical protein